MNDGHSFIGMGNNPDANVPDIPLGLGMALMQEAGARDCFEQLSASQKTKVIDYVQNNVSGEDAKHKIASAVENLRMRNTDFIDFQ